MSSRSSGENEIAAAIWGRDRSNWGGCFASFLFGGYFLRYELFSIGGVHPDRTNRGGNTNTLSTLPAHCRLLAVAAPRHLCSLAPGVAPGRARRAQNQPRGVGFGALADHKGLSNTGPKKGVPQRKSSKHLWFWVPCCFAGE